MPCTVCGRYHDSDDYCQPYVLSGAHERWLEDRYMYSMMLADTLSGGLAPKAERTLRACATETASQLGIRVGD